MMLAGGEGKLSKRVGFGEGRNTKGEEKRTYGEQEERQKGRAEGYSNLGDQKDQRQDERENDVGWRASCQQYARKRRGRTKKRGLPPI